MKKIFLSLLALVGMAGGLLCTSCSGGAGKDKNGPARAVAGLILDLWPSMTPAFRKLLIRWRVGASLIRSLRMEISLS